MEVIQTARGDAPGAPAAEPVAFHKHFDFGVLREVPAGSLRYEAWIDGQDGEPGLWHTIRFNPFTASMSRITRARAAALVGDGDLDAPVENLRYEQETREALARQGIHEGVTFDHTPS